MAPLTLFFYHGAIAPEGQGLLIVLGFMITQNDTPQSVGLLWTSDQPDADSSTWQHKTHKRQTSMFPAGFEPTIPASEYLQTHALDRVATEIDSFHL